MLELMFKRRSQMFEMKHTKKMYLKKIYLLFLTICKEVQVVLLVMIYLFGSQFWRTKGGWSIRWTNTLHVAVLPLSLRHYPLRRIEGVFLFSLLFLLCFILGTMCILSVGEGMVVIIVMHCLGCCACVLLYFVMFKLLYMCVYALFYIILFSPYQ